MIFDTRRQCLQRKKPLPGGGYDRLIFLPERRCCVMSEQRANRRAERVPDNVPSKSHDPVQTTGNAATWFDSLMQWFSNGDRGTSDAYTQSPTPGRRWTAQRVEAEFLGSWPSSHQFEQDLAASISKEKIGEVLKRHAGAVFDHPVITAASITLFEGVVRALASGVRNRNPYAGVGLLGVEGIRRFGLLGVAGYQFNAWFSAVEAMKGDRTTKLEMAQYECARFTEVLVMMVLTKALGGVGKGVTRGAQANRARAPRKPVLDAARPGQLIVPGGELAVTGRRQAEGALATILRFLGLTAPLVGASETQEAIEAAAWNWMVAHPFSGTSQEIERQMAAGTPSVPSKERVRPAPSPFSPIQASAHFSDEDLECLVKEVESLKRGNRDEMSEGFVVFSIQRALKHMVFDDTAPIVDVVPGDPGDRLIGYLNPKRWEVTVNVRRIQTDVIDAPLETIVNEIAQTAYQIREVILAGRLVSETTKAPSAIETKLGVSRFVAEMISPQTNLWAQAKNNALTSDERLQAQTYLDTKPTRDEAMRKLSAALQDWQQVHREPATRNPLDLDHHAAAERLRVDENYWAAQRELDQLPGQAHIIAAGAEAEQFFRSAQIPDDGLIALSRSIAQAAQPIVLDWNRSTAPTQQRIIAFQNLINDALKHALGDSEVPTLTLTIVDAPGESTASNLFDSKTWNMKLISSLFPTTLTRVDAAKALGILVAQGREAEQTYRSAIYERHYANSSREQMLQSGYSPLVVDSVLAQTHPPLSAVQTKSNFDSLSSRGALHDIKHNLYEQRMVAADRAEAARAKILEAMDRREPVPARDFLEFNDAMRQFEKIREEHDRVSGYADAEKTGLHAGLHYLSQAAH